VKRFVLDTKSDFRKRRKTAAKPKAIDNHHPCLGFRMFRPPLRAVVQIDRGLPAQISAWGKQRSLYGKVVNVAGPWRTTGDWWRDDRWARDEWDVAVTSGKHGSEQQAIYRIYRELNTDAWFVEGAYD
jgi:protein ImuB